MGIHTPLLSVAASVAQSRDVLFLLVFIRCVQRLHQALNFESSRMSPLIQSNARRLILFIFSRYDDEVARHKALDALGDLALGGTLGHHICLNPKPETRNPRSPYLSKPSAISPKL